MSISNSFLPIQQQLQGAIISLQLEYIAPSNAPQSTVCFGSSPSGTMKATAGKTPGFLEFEYVIPAAQQRPYHPDPNVWHSSTRRVAYLPDTEEGRKILFRFQYAFLHGLSFSVGRSIASGLDNQVTWSPLIPHRSGTTSGPRSFSFPDPGYIPLVSLALDSLGVPKDPGVCCQWILQNQALLSIASRTGDGSFGVSALPTTRVALGIVGQGSSPSNDTSLGMAMLPPTRVELGIRGQGSLSSSERETLCYDADSSLSAGDTTSQCSGCLERVLVSKEEEEKGEECPICLEKMVSNPTSDDDEVVCIQKCQHRFHRKCIMEMFALSHTTCPNCREPVGVEPRGQGPSGSMSIAIKPNVLCKGFECNSDGTIVLTYRIQSGIQLPFMENPGQRYSGTHRVAYLPNNDSGRKLLSRLKYAFTHGLTFRVGTSLTTGRSNQTTWTSIHHKTSLNQGAHGYPDRNYFANCNASLDALRVPKAEDCT